MCFLLVSSAPHLSPIRFISPPFTCTAPPHWTFPPSSVFQLISHIPVSGVFLFFSLTCVSPPALISLERFVCVVRWLSVGPSVQLSSSRPSCYPASVSGPHVFLFVLCFCLNSLHPSTFCDTSALLLLDFGLDFILIHLLCPTSCMSVDSGRSHDCQPLPLLY